MESQSILIVEDEAVVALDLQLQLGELGYAVQGIAASGDAALALVRQRVPSLVLMDVRLQGPLDGIEVAEAIRREHDIPIIFLTSHSDDDTVRRAARTAPYGYLTKPYQIRELRAGIEVALTKWRMERQLKEADRWFAHTLQCVADGVIVTDLEARVRFVNPAAERLTGWTLDDALGHDVAEVVRFAPTVGAPGGSGALVRSVLRQGRPTPVAHAVSLLGRDGRERVVDQTAGPVDDDSGTRLGAVLVLHDAAERVAQEALLRASEQRFRNAFDHAPLGMALVSLAGEFIQVNDALCRLLGTTPEELKRHRQLELTLDADAGHELARLHELMLAPGGVVQFERRYRRLDGRAPVWALVSVSLMHEGDQPTCHLYQVHDLTEQKAAAEQIAELAEERMRRQASEMASSAKSEFLSRVSHEMRTPLNAVIGFAQLLQLPQVPEGGKALAYAQHIRSAGEHLLALVTDLLDLNRTAQGTLLLTPQPLALAEVVDECLHLLENLGRTHGIELHAEVPAELKVLADPTRLRQVLINLGSNAVKYNREGGSVQVRARRSGSGRIRLTVEDSGIGMTREQLDRLFQPFERLGRERSKIPGIGLGLVIARGLVLEMGGTLEIASRPRAGTTVTIELPAAP